MSVKPQIIKRKLVLEGNLQKPRLPKAKKQASQENRDLMIYEYIMSLKKDDFELTTYDNEQDNTESTEQPACFLSIKSEAFSFLCPIMDDYIQKNRTASVLCAENNYEEAAYLLDGLIANHTPFFEVYEQLIGIYKSTRQRQLEFDLINYTLAFFKEKLERDWKLVEQIALLFPNSDFNDEYTTYGKNAAYYLNGWQIYKKINEDKLMKRLEFLQTRLK